MKSIEQTSYIAPFVKGIVLSYSSIFFSQSMWLGMVMLGITFLSPLVGFYGFMSCLIANLFAILLTNDLVKISTGVYGFNAIFVGLAIGFFFPHDFFYVLIAGLLSLLLTLALEGVGERLQVPFLAFPFLMCFWIVLLMTQQQGEMATFSAIVEAGQYSFLSSVDNYLEDSLPTILIDYFKCVSLIFFQSSVVCGILVSVALLCFSRIAFSLSVLGCLIAHLLFASVGLERYGIPFCFYGFNFILTSIAIGGYYVIPSRASYLWVLLLLPIQFVVAMASLRLFSFLFLPIFTFPFCFTTAIFIYILGRIKPVHNLSLAYYKEKTPEETLYLYQENKKEAWLKYEVESILPIMGEWTVYQGIDGEYTHKGIWHCAWDFVIEDEKGSQYKGVGDLLNDYYCFRKPVVVASSGVVVAVYDGVSDNRIGEVNQAQNWGNYIVIKHADSIYSAVCHLEKNTINYKIGDFVERGAILALCGNSGYSPFPHLHFQFQTTAQMGSPTLNCRFSAYLSQGKIVTASQPQKGEKVANLSLNEVLAQTYKFKIGQTVRLHSDLYGEELWRVESDALGKTYFTLSEKNCKAWFYNDGLQFRFFRYEGSTQCALYHFYKANYHIPFLSEGTISEQAPITLIPNTILKYWQDFIAPFYLFIKAEYAVSVLNGEVQALNTCYILKKLHNTTSYKTIYKSQYISGIEIKEENKVWKILFLN